MRMKELKMDFLIVKCDQKQVRTQKGDKNMIYFKNFTFLYNGAIFQKI